MFLKEDIQTLNFKLKNPLLWEEQKGKDEGFTKTPKCFDCFELHTLYCPYPKFLMCVCVWICRRDEISSVCHRNSSQITDNYPLSHLI